MRTRTPLAALSLVLFACGADTGADANAADAETGTDDAAAAEAADEAEPAMIDTDSGLRYQVLREGEGASPVPGQTVVVHYRGTLPDGVEFDSSYGGDPAEFAVDGVIAGFSEALQLMRPGGHVRAYVPSGLGYGEQGAGGLIGPNQDLVFEIELLEVR